MRTIRTCAWLGIALAAALAAPVARATVLTFDANLGYGSAIPQDYGDRVIAGTMGDYHYESEGGWTPNVETAYATEHEETYLTFYWDSFNDLSGVANNEYADDWGDTGFSITLTADPGCEVLLYGFAVGNWDYMDLSVPIRVTGAADQVLYEERVSLPDRYGPHADIDFRAGPLASQQLTIHVDTSQLEPATWWPAAADSFGLDNIAFGQVPEPATLALLALGGLGVLIRRRRK